MTLPEEFFEAIVGWNSIHIDSGRPAERRNRGRMRLPTRVQVIAMAGPEAVRPMTVQVRDLSPQGIGLLIPKKMARGNGLLVRLQTKELTLWVFCEVARAERVAEGLYVVGASFKRVVDPFKAKTAAASA